MTTELRHITLALGVLLACGGIGLAGERQPSPADLQFDFAEGLYRDGLRKLAIPELAKFLKSHPDDPRGSLAGFYLGESQYGEKDYKAALASFEAAERDAKLSHRLVALYRLGDCRFRLGDNAGAVEPLRQFLASKAETTDARPFILPAKYILARALFAQRSFAEALPLFEEVLSDRSPENAYKTYVLLPIGDCLSALGKPDDALARYRELEKALAAGPAQPEVQSRKAEMLHGLRAKMASILLGQRKHEEGLALLRSLDDTGAFAEEILYGRAQALFTLQRSQDALGPALEYLKRFPQGRLATSALYVAGECYYRTQRFAEAEGCFARFLEADKEAKHPDREAAAYGRAASAYRQDAPRAKEAAAAAEFFLQHFPNSLHASDAQFFRAEAAFWLTDYPAAAERYRKVPPTSPYAEDATHRVAVCLDLLKRRDEAAAAYDAYAAQYPKGKHLKTALERSARLWGEQAQFAKAAERYGAFAAKFGEDDPKTGEEFLYRKGACEYESKQYEPMSQTLKAYLERYPTGSHRGDAHYFLAGYQSDVKHQYEPAAEHYALCASLPGSYRSRARHVLAYTYKKIADTRLAADNKNEANLFYGKAAESFLVLIRTEPQELRGHAEYLWAAEVLRDLGRKAEAIEAFEALIKSYPAEAKPEVIYRLGDLALKLSPPDYKKAEDNFRLFLKSFPADEYVIWASFGLAETLKGAKKGTKEHGEAWELYQKVEQLAAHKIEAPRLRDGLILRCKLQIGLMAFDDKNYEYARDYLLRVGYLATGDEAAEALYKAGRAVLHLKDADAALAIWQRLLREHRQSPWAEQLLREAAGLGLRPTPDGKSVEKKLPAS